MSYQRTRRNLWWWGGALLLWMGLIFSFSAMPGSGRTADVPMWYILERKGAHVFEFAVLSFLAYGFFRQFFGEKRKHSYIIVVVLVFAFLYGVFDEVHQSFVFGRGSRFSDVLIDLVGSSLACLTLTVFLRVRALKKRQKMLH